MSDIFKKEFYSALKWIVVIVVAGFTYEHFSHKYHFKGDDAYIKRANQITGKVEHLGIRGKKRSWLNVSEIENE